MSFKALTSKSIVAPTTQKDSSATPKATPQSTPFPFQELTIPYLQNRNYSSKIGELQENDTFESYKSYLTNYISDGLQINALLTVPTTQQPEGGYPAIVFVHGYIPPSLYKTEQNYASYVDYFARRGFVVFKIDLRGHDESEGEAGGAYYSGDYVVDVLHAYIALQNFDQVNKNKIGLWGHSMAGNIVIRAMAAMPSIPKVVIWAGAVYTYSDFAEFRISDESYRPPSDDSTRRQKRDELFQTHGQFDPDSWFWQQVPATNYLADITGEIQIHHAVNDDVVAIGYSRRLDEILDSTTIPHELFEYTTGGHNITGSAFTQAMQRSVEFYLQ